MATPKLLHLRSNVRGKLPAAGAIQVGQIGINYNSQDPFLCIKDSSGVVRRLGGVAMTATAPTAPQNGDLWVDLTTATSPVLKVWDGSNWVAASGGTKSGTTAPTPAAAGDVWVDLSGTAPVVKVYNGTAWNAVGGNPPAATTSTPGIVQLAAAADVTAGASDRVVTADLLKTTVASGGYILPAATTAKLGGVIAGSNVTVAADGTLAVRAATNAVDGAVRIATDAEATAGTLETVAVNPKQLKGVGLPAVTNAGDVLTLESVGGATLAPAWKAPASTYTLPVATASQLGGIKAGTGVTVGADGTLSVALSGGLTYKGQTNPTATAPAAPVNGDVWIASAGGAYHTSWGLTGTATAGELLIYEGSKWDAVGQASAPVKSDWSAAAGAAGEILNKPGDATTTAAGLMSAADKTKLDGVAAAAEANVQSDWNEASNTSDAFIKNKPTIPGSATTAAEGTVRLADAAAITAGTAGRVVDAAQLKVVNDAIATATGGGITGITPTAPITVTGTGATRTIGIDAASTSASGAMSAADKSKLDGISAGAQVNVKPDWNAVAGDAAEVLNKPTIPAAYVLPAATAAALGGIKVGSGLQVQADGTLAVSVSGALVFKGAKDPTAAAPASPSTGDVYVFNKAGTAAASWSGIAGQSVSLHEVVAWDGTEWALFGAVGSTSVTQVNATSPLHATGTSTVALTVDAASNIAAGVVRLATDAEATAGTLETVAVNPRQLKANVPSAATTAAAGIVRLADSIAVGAGTAGRVVDAAQLKAAVPGAATISTAGIVQLADAAAITAGTAGRIVDAAQLKANVPTLADASETVKGIVRLATAAETTTGTANTVAVTPQHLKAELDKRIAKNIATLPVLP